MATATDKIAVLQSKRLELVQSLTFTCDVVFHEWCKKYNENLDPLQSTDEFKSLLYGVYRHAINFFLTGEHSAEDAHENWLIEKMADGWIYGHAKEPEKKQHPCICSFATLPKAQQMKYKICKTVVDMFRKSVVNRLAKKKGNEYA